MEEKQEKKLRKLLAKWGVTEEELNEFVDEYNNTPDEEEEIVEEKVENEPEVEPTADVEEAESDEVEAEEPLAEEEPTEEPLVDEPKAEEPQPTEEPMEEVNETVEEPMEEPMVEEPKVEDTKYTELQAQVQTLQETIEGLTAKLEALQKNIVESGVFEIEETKAPIGVDENKAPANEPYSNNTASVVEMMNRGRGY